MTATKSPSPTNQSAGVIPSVIISDSVRLSEGRAIRMARQTVRGILETGAYPVGSDEVRGVVMLLRGHIMELTHALFLVGKEPGHERIGIARELSGQETPSDLSEARAHIDALSNATQHLLELLAPADTLIADESRHGDLAAGGAQ